MPIPGTHWKGNFPGIHEVGSVLFLAPVHYLLPLLLPLPRRPLLRHSLAAAASRRPSISPADERYFAPAVINCKDGSNSFSRDRLNDDFCDCVDGTDEPGTSACPRGKFYCRNVGSTPKFIFSSRVNDQVCDCCDGSDELGNGVNCPNTCIMGGGRLEYKAGNYLSYLDAKRAKDAKAKEWKHQAGIEELLQKITGLKMVLLLQGLLVASVVIIHLLKRRFKARRRRHHQ